MKTLKFSIILCIILVFFYINASAQKPIVINHEEWTWGLSPADVPCLAEPISGLAILDGFFTNSSRGEEVYKWNYKEKGECILTGQSTGEKYFASWTFNESEISFDDGFPKHSKGVAHTNITHDGKLFMTINFQYNYVWNAPWTNPIVWRNVFNPQCK